uniref:Uncharacterized protein n=1 Tax=Romanomermis culicivorax TaxID=13658 RepID=A0A915J3H2_ROMCU
MPFCPIGELVEWRRHWFCHLWCRRNGIEFWREPKAPLF